MKYLRLFSKSRSLRLSTAILLVAALYSAATFSLIAETSLKLTEVSVPGADGSLNNTLFVFDRYLIVAPFAPSVDINEDADLSEYDNHFVRLIDTKKPDRDILSADLQAYYPSKILYDPVKANVFIRGTEYDYIGGGEYEPTDVITQLRLNLDDNGKPIFGSTAVKIRIPGVNASTVSSAPENFVLGRQGDLLVFSNGASIFTYNVVKGFLYEVGFVSPIDYGPNNRISFFNVDPASNTLVVAVSKKEEIEEDNRKYSSVIKFYRLEEDGSITALKELNEGSFPEGAALTAGNNVAISSDSTTGSPEYGYFIISDGSLCQVDLRGNDLFGTINILNNFPELAQADPGNASPRIVEYDSSKRLVVIVNQGFVTDIRRPINIGRGGRIRRPINIHRVVELPAFVLATLNKKSTRVTSSNTYSGGFEETGGLSNFVLDQESRGLIATYDGKLFSVNLSGDVAQASLNLEGDIGSRVDQIQYNSARSTLAAINSVALDEETSQMTTPGSLIVAKLQSGANQASSTSLIQMFTLGKPLLASVVTSIRRPCNVRR